MSEDKLKEFKRIMTTAVKEQFQFPRSRITKKSFEQKFMCVAAGRDCYVTPHTENSVDEDGHPTIVNMSLYYIEDAHAATWLKGEGWIFSDEVITKAITQNAFLSDAYPDLDNVTHS